MATDSQVLAEAVLAIYYRYPTGTVFESSAISGEYFRAKLAGYRREVFAVAFLNYQHQLLAYEEIFEGSIAGVEIHPREVVYWALLLNAAAVILSHNHPSFTPEPSQADIAITARLKTVLVGLLSILSSRVMRRYLLQRGDTLTAELSSALSSRAGSTPPL